MPTNIINAGYAPSYGPNAWESIGEGAQGLAALVGQAMAANEAGKPLQPQTLSTPESRNDWSPDSGGSMNGYALNALAPPPQYQAPDPMSGSVSALASRPIAGMVAPIKPITPITQDLMHKFGGNQYGGF